MELRKEAFSLADPSVFAPFRAVALFRLFVEAEGLEVLDLEVLDLEVFALEADDLECGTVFSDALESCPADDCAVPEAFAIGASAWNRSPLSTNATTTRHHFRLDPTTFHEGAEKRPPHPCQILPQLLPEISTH